MNTESVGISAEELHPETETTAIEDNDLNTRNISPSADELSLGNRSKDNFDISEVVINILLNNLSEFELKTKGIGIRRNFVP